MIQSCSSEGDEYLYTYKRKEVKKMKKGWPFEAIGEINPLGGESGGGGDFPG